MDVHALGSSLDDGGRGIVAASSPSILTEVSDYHLEWVMQLYYFPSPPLALGERL